MDKLKLGGFPPLIKKKNNKITIKKELQPQFFSNVSRTNINIREILNKKTDLFDEKKDETLEEIDEL